MKKIIAILLCGLLFAGCGSVQESAVQRNAETPTPSPTEATTETPVPQETQSAIDEETNKLRDAMVEKYAVDYRGEVTNDKTGNWRLSFCNTDAHISEYVFDYYAAFFESDEEIHFIINNKTGEDMFAEE